jgi:hypothetical protein
MLDWLSDPTPPAGLGRDGTSRVRRRAIAYSTAASRTPSASGRASGVAEFFTSPDKRIAPARMPHRKIVHPSPEDRADQLDHPSHRLAGVSSEYVPELPCGHLRLPARLCSCAFGTEQGPSGKLDVPSRRAAVLYTVPANRLVSRLIPVRGRLRLQGTVSPWKRSS